MGSRFGGIPIDESPSTSKFGGVAVSDAPNTSKTEADYYREHPGQTILGFGKTLNDKLTEKLTNLPANILHMLTAQGPEAKYNAQHALDSIDPSVILPSLKKAIQENDLDTVAGHISDLAIQAALAKAGPSAVESAPAAEEALGAAGNLAKTGAQGAVAAVKAKPFAPTGAVIGGGAASRMLGMGYHEGALAVEGGHAAYQAIKGAREAIANARAQAASDAAVAEQRANPRTSLADQAGIVPEAPSYPPVEVSAEELTRLRNEQAARIAARKPPPEPVKAAAPPKPEPPPRIPLWKRTAVPTEEPSSVTVQDILQKPSVGSKLDAGQPITLEDLQKFGEESAPLKMRSVEPEDYTSVLQEMLNMKPAELRQRVADFTRRKPKK